MNAFTQVATTSDDDSTGSPVSTLLFGVFMVVAAGGLYLYFTDLEQRGDTTRIHWLVALLYNTGGKDLVAILLGGLGALMIIFGAISWMRQNRS
jgi:hypothetical protein